MASRTTRNAPSRGAVVRTVGFGIAVALGAIGLWLVVTGGKSTQRVELGVLVGLWGLLLGAICGRRLVLAEGEDAAADEPAPPVPPVPHAERHDLAVRPDAAVDREQDAAARRAFAAELQQLLRAEIDTAVRTAVDGAVGSALAHEVGRLRAEIAELRQELVDNVGGQLRLERIETTRLIGSDLEAMRAELDRLKSLNAAAPAVDERRVADVIDVRPPPAVVAPPAGPQPPAPAAAPPPPQPGDDPFASLPRLTPFTDVDLGLDPEEGDDAAHRYSGRRRREEIRLPQTHVEPAEPAAPAPAAAEEPTGRRHRRDDPAGEDLLARLLAREGAGH